MFWNNTNRISTDLFQCYFNMSMSVQQSINSLSDLLQAQKADAAKQGGKRQASDQKTLLEVKNSNTGKLLANIEGLQTKISALKLTLRGLNEANKDLQRKHKTLEERQKQTQ